MDGGINKGILIGFHQVDAGQKIVCRIDADQIFPFNPKEFRQTGTAANKNGIKTLLLKKFFNRERGADQGV